MWESSKNSRLAGYQDLDRVPCHHATSHGSRTSHVLTVMVSLLCFTSVLGIIAMTYRSFNSPNMIVIPIHELDKKPVSMKPVLDITEGGGWSQSGSKQLGKLPPPNTPDPKWDPEPSDSELGLFDYAAVSVDSIPCAKIGKDIMLMGGNAIDSAIATMYCNTVVNSQSMGIGGGFIMTIYLGNGTRMSMIARETAPAAASKDMYHGDANLTHYGPLASGIPGFVAGTWELKEKLGNKAVSWMQLLQPSIDMCFEGIVVNNHAYHMLHQERERVKADPGLSAVFVNPRTNDIWQEGDVYTFPSLGKTLRAIAVNGAKEFYEGETAQKLVADIQAAGGIITMEDMKNYRIRWEKPVEHKLKNLGYTLISSPPPGSGAILTSILGVMDAFKISPLDMHRPLTWHRFIEACKYGYAGRTEMGDWHSPEIREMMQEMIKNLTSQAWVEQIKSQIDDTQTYSDPEHYGAKEFLNEDHGTCQHSFLSPDGDAVSVTASVNLIWGCKFMSPSTGIIMNNQMDDFASPNITSAYDVPPAKNNFIAPGKRPMSSMSTTVVIDDDGRVIAVAGASGGTKIITAVAQTLMRILYLGQDVKEAVDARRFHHQLFPMNLNYEDGITTWMRDALINYGHNMTYSKFRVGGSAVQAIFVDPKTGKIQANADFRKMGAVDGF